MNALSNLDLAGRVAAFRAGNPKARIRDIADALGIGEAALVEIGAAGKALRLRPAWTDLLKALPAVGEVMVLTRNVSCVHERHGRFREVSVDGHVGLVLGPDIDLRIFLNHWSVGYAIEADDGRKSLQIFAADGEAVFKIYRVNDTDRDAFAKLTAQFLDPAAPELELSASPVALVGLDDGEIDVGGLRAAWASLRDTHDFFPMLRKFKVQREQALRLADPKFAERLVDHAVGDLFDRAAAQIVPIMVFVGSRGVIQIHTGTVTNIKRIGPWLNVLDPIFNLHLRADHVAQAWRVRKPTADGIVTSVELFDKQGNLIAQMFGARKPGEPERDDWRALAEGLACA